MVKRITALLCAACCLLPLAACGQSETASSTQEIFAMDTIMDITAYGDSAETAVAASVQRINALDALLSTNNTASEIYAVNQAGGTPVTVSSDTLTLVQDALTLCARTGGALDISIYPVLTAWGFTTSSYQIPDAATIENLLQYVDYSKVLVDSAASTITLSPGMEIDLGAVAKGYTGDQVMAVMAGSGVTSAVISLGGNVQVLGTKPDGSNWNVGVTDPENPDSYFGVLSVHDTAVVTSGGYERYFVGDDGVTYWHILDPDTGYPARAGLISTTIVCSSGVTADALSTAMFVKGLDGAEEYWRENGGFEAVFVTDDDQIYITSGLKDSFSLSSGYESRSVQVIEP